MSKKQKTKTTPPPQRMREWRETVVGREVGGVIPDQKKKRMEMVKCLKGRGGVYNCCVNHLRFSPTLPLLVSR